jgi:hypothetical protein
MSMKYKISLQEILVETVLISNKNLVDSNCFGLDPSHVFYSSNQH